MKVLITGGSGYLGRAILRHMGINYEHDFTVYSRDEAKQWEIAHRFPNVRLVLGDVRDEDKLEYAMAGQDVIIHAAAVKFIPEAERNVDETIGVNVEGSRAVARAAVKVGVPRVVGISTDKACSPQTTYGTTKLLMEREFAEFDRAGRTRFVVVRYGNVVGSTGSVVPVLRRQLEETGRMSLTDPAMTRFWLPANQAVRVIEWALEWAGDWSGHVFVPTCPAMTLLNLAEAIWRLWLGDTNREVPTDEMAYDVVGIRTTEKIHEVLLEDWEGARAHKSGLGYVLGAPTAPFVQRPIARYSSDAPSTWVEPQQMMDWIKQAQGI